MRALPLLLALCMLAAPIGVAAVSPGAGSSGTAGTIDATDAASGAGSGTIDSVDATNDVSASTGVRFQAEEESNETSEENQRYRVLTVPADQLQRTGVNRQGGDVGPTLDLAVDETTERMETVAMRNHIEAAETNDERQRRIIAAVSEVQQDEVTLHQRHRDAINAHANGELSDRELLVELASVAIDAQTLRDRLVVLDRLADDTDDFGIGSDVNELDFRLQSYDGPIRSYTIQVVQGERPATQMYVESGENTVTISAVIDGEYARETFRGDRWARDGSTFTSPEEGINVTAREYPETVAAGNADAIGTTTTRVDVTYPEGTLRTFNSAGNEQVFKEHQIQTLDLYEHAETRQRTRDGLNVTVNYAYRGGPIQVVVRDVEDGEPVEGVRVTLRAGGDSSEVVGETDDDGILWTLSPNEAYGITVIDGSSVVPIEDIEPAEPSTVAESSDGGEE